MEAAPRAGARSDVSSLQAVVRELRWSAARTSAARYLVHALVAATGWIFVVLIASRLLPVEQSLRVAMLGVPAVLVAVGYATDEHITPPLTVGTHEPALPFTPIAGAPFWR